MKYAPMAYRAPDFFLCCSALNSVAAGNSFFTARPQPLKIVYNGTYKLNAISRIVIESEYDEKKKLQISERRVFHWGLKEKRALMWAAL